MLLRPAAADLLAAEGIEATVVDPRWVKPLDPALVELARAHRRWSPSRQTPTGGVGAAVSQALQTRDHPAGADPGHPAPSSSTTPSARPSWSGSA